MPTTLQENDLIEIQLPKLTPPSPPPLPERAPIQSAPHDAGLNPYRWIILVAVLTGAFLELLDSTSVNVALREMGGNLGATPDEIAWVVTGYILSNVVVLPMTAWLSSLFGRRRYLFYSILLFTIASLCCGLSQTLGELVFWRIVQGAGGAALLSTAQATLREVFPIEQQGMVQSLYIIVVVIGPTFGPAFGGWMMDNYSWPWIFFSKAPIGFVAAFLVWRFLSDSAHAVAPTRIDFLGIGLMTVGLGSLQYVLEEGERNDWLNDPFIAGLIALSVVTLIAFVAWELWRGNEHPVVNLRVLRHTNLTAGVVMLAVGGFGMYGGSFILPLFTQQILGFSATTAGLIFLPSGLSTIVTAMLCGRLLNGAKPLMAPQGLIALGMVGFALSMWMLSHLSPQSGEGDIQLALIIRGASMGFLLTPITVASLSSLRAAEIAQGAGLTNLFRQLGGSFGIAVINTYLTQMTDTHRSYLVGDIFSGNQSLGQRHSGLAEHLIAHGYSAASASGVAMGMVDRSVQVQSQTMAYNDSFQLICLAFVLALPALFLLRKGR